MNSYNLALETEQNQRLIADQAAIDDEANQQTDLYVMGQSDAIFGCDPAHPEDEAYWAGYSLVLRQQWMAKNNSLPQEFEHKQKQGELCISHYSLSRKYGKITAIGEERDYKGWQIEIKGLQIDLVTYNWEEVDQSSIWSVYAANPESMVFLAEIFGDYCVRDNIAKEYGFTA